MVLAMNASRQTHSALAFGLRWSSDLPLHGFGSTGADGAPADIVVRQAPAHLRAREVVVASGGAALCTDGIRFQAGREATFDTLGTGHIEWSPGEAWTGALPTIFFGTLTALLLAWRGCIVLHGTAVEIGGGAVLVCGASGAGKSTLGAGLIALGAKLISDDLSLLTLPETGDAVFLYAGRPAMRLFPRIAGYLKDANATTHIESFAGEKDFVFPPRVAPLMPIPLKAMIVLGSIRGTVAPAHKAPLLHAQLFRPRWMASIPGHAASSARIPHAAHRLRMITMPSLKVRDAESFFGNAAAAAEQMEACHTRQLV
jgi:hypothetical protein